ncbi:uncharacterized protein LOC121685452 isoform X2 [Alosa sapidissima]|uniref:uncharacterized protein LOC121685452 isoform X2 n=1 Tax=Alosa sapidissima TaxID=34773 RepID=UPI001C083920|nr:uncharacterized protein LOC121685452 isoform X2 [Alosa sapidissima]
MGFLCLLNCCISQQDDYNNEDEWQSYYKKVEREKREQKKESALESLKEIKKRLKKYTLQDLKRELEALGVKVEDACGAKRNHKSEKKMKRELRKLVMREMKRAHLQRRVQETEEDEHDTSSQSSLNLTSDQDRSSSQESLEVEAPLSDMLDRVESGLSLSEQNMESLVVEATLNDILDKVESDLTAAKEAAEEKEAVEVKAALNDLLSGNGTELVTSLSGIQDEVESCGLEEKQLDKDVKAPLENILESVESPQRGTHADALTAVTVEAEKSVEKDADEIKAVSILSGPSLEVGLPRKETEKEGQKEERRLDGPSLDQVLEDLEMTCNALRDFLETNKRALSKGHYEEAAGDQVEKEEPVQMEAVGILTLKETAASLVDVETSKSSAEEQKNNPLQTGAVQKKKVRRGKRGRGAKGNKKTNTTTPLQNEGGEERSRAHPPQTVAAGRGDRAEERWPANHKRSQREEVRSGAHVRRQQSQMEPVSGSGHRMRGRGHTTWTGGAGRWDGQWRGPVRRWWGGAQADYTQWGGEEERRVERDMRHLRDWHHSQWRGEYGRHPHYWQNGKQ